MAILLCFGLLWFWDLNDSTAVPTYCNVTEVTVLEKGEKIKFADINPYFRELFVDGKTDDYFTKEETDGNKKHYQGAKAMAVSIGDNTVFVDEDGYVNALATGVYKLEYTVVNNYTGNARFGYKRDTAHGYTFANTIVVYDSEENYVPFPTSKNEYDPTASYILTEDVTLDSGYQQVLNQKSFQGVLVNPNGYTLTWVCETHGRGFSGMFSRNYGIIDGLKLKVVSSEEIPFYERFYGIVADNYGVLKNCEITGDIYVEGLDSSREPIVSVFPDDGWVMNNTASVTVYYDDAIEPMYGELDGVVQEVVANNWICRDNTIAIQAYYFSDKVLCRRRNVEISKKLIENNNVCLHPTLGETARNWTYVVTLKVPVSGGDYTYERKGYAANSVLEIKKEQWETVFGGMYDGGDLEVRYWLVDGIKYESLNDIVVTKSLTVEPCVKYNKNYYFSSKIDGTAPYVDLYGIRNSEEVFYLSDFASEEDTVRPRNSLFASFFDDPHNVIPSKIVFGKNLIPNQDPLFDEDSRNALYQWMLDGGVLEIADGNPELVLIGGKMLCREGGKKLEYYFSEDWETDIVLHPQITSVAKNAFFAGENYRSVDFGNASSIVYTVLEPCVSLEKVKFGENFTDGSVRNLYSGYASVPKLLSFAKGLKEIVVDEGNTTYCVENNFLLQNTTDANRTLVCALPSLTGTVTLPEDITQLADEAFCGSSIETVVFSACEGSFYFNEGAFVGMDRLKKISFGKAQTIVAQGKYGVELPALEEITFDDETETIRLDDNSFSGAALGTVVFPKNMQELRYGFSCRNYGIPEGNSAGYFTEDGVLYQQTATRLILKAYPARATAEKYEVRSGTKEIAFYAFYNASVKETVCPATLTEVSSYAFYKAAVESIRLQAEETVFLRNYAFCESALKEISVEKSAYLNIQQGAFESCEALTSFPYENVTSIDTAAFRGSGIEYFEFGSQLTYLGSDIFKGSQIRTAVFADDLTLKLKGSTFADSALESVSLGGVTGIGDSEFQNCANLKTFDLKSLVRIPDAAFYGTGLESVQSDYATEIGGQAFAYCAALKRVVFPNATSIGKETFAEAAVSEVSLPKVAEIPAGAFKGCKELVSLEVAEKVSVGKEAFNGCKALVGFSSTIVDIGENAFGECASVEELTIERKAEGVLSVSVGMFTGCTSLRTISLAAESVEIATGAFAGCTALAQVNVKTDEAGGKIAASAFVNLTQEVEICLDVSATFVWEGRVPQSFILYVPAELAEQFAAEWLVKAEQIRAYDF